MHPRHVTGQTPNGTRYAYKKSTTNIRTWTLPLDLTFAQKESLVNFYNDDADGPANTFSFTHTDGHTYTVRFVDTNLDFIRVAPNSWSTTIKLETSEAITDDEWSGS